MDISSPENPLAEDLTKPYQTIPNLIDLIVTLTKDFLPTVLARSLPLLSTPNFQSPIHASPDGGCSRGIAIFTPYTPQKILYAKSFSVVLIDNVVIE
ncbi:hypothetical protein AB0756_39475 [Tolypothrix campylonemoides VB511288_2]|uniref:Uncharacterized protein n=3 Tax=Nostocales TaxID=1161 RepID=A0A0C1R7H2_9CYAN